MLYFLLDILLLDIFQKLLIKNNNLRNITSF